MSAQFSIDVDSARDLVAIRMSGFFTHDDIRAFLEARRAAHARLRCAPNAHVTINDIRGMKIQSQEIVEAFREMLGADDEYRSRRLAFVVSPTLARTQVMRALDRRVARCFESRISAEVWIFSTASDAAAA